MQLAKQAHMLDDIQAGMNPGRQIDRQTNWKADKYVCRQNGRQASSLLVE